MKKVYLLIVIAGFVIVSILSCASPNVPPPVPLPDIKPTPIQPTPLASPPAKVMPPTITSPSYMKAYYLREAENFQRQADTAMDNASHYQRMMASQPSGRMYSYYGSQHQQEMDNSANYQAEVTEYLILAMREPENESITPVSLARIERLMKIEEEKAAIAERQRVAENALRNAELELARKVAQGITPQDMTDAHNRWMGR